MNTHRIVIREAVAGGMTAGTRKRVHNYYRSLEGAQRGLKRLRVTHPETAACARIEELRASA